jgi:hypothetical protein
MATILKAGNVASGAQITSDSTGILEIKTGTGAGTTAMVLDASQNVGIGITPGYRLHVQSGAATYSVVSTSGGIIANVGASDAAGFAQFGTVSNTPTIFQTNNTEQARITTAGLFQFNSGYGSVATAFGCRAWVNFNGTGTVAIRASGNVTSITDGGTGNYTVNFTTAMPDANYGVNIQSTTSGAYTVAVLNGTYSTTAVQFVTSDFASTLRDPATICVSITR